MLLKEFIASIISMVKDNPELLKAEVVYARDDEGNCFQPTHYHPSPGIFNRGGFETSKDVKKINAVCIN